MRTTRILLAVSAAIGAGAALPDCGGSAQKTSTRPLADCGTTATPAAVSAAPGSASWPYPGGNTANTRDAVGSTISSANVKTLRQVWTFKITGTAAAGVAGTGSLAANPIVENGLVYIQDLDSNVYAVALATGKLVWECHLDRPELSGPGPNGIAVADGRVYGTTPKTVFALNAATGRSIWVDSDPLSAEEGTFGIQPQVANGRVYLASQYGSGSGGGPLMALDAANGKLLWKFNTVVGAHPGVSAIGVGSGGAWETPLVSGDGSVTFGIGNPYQSAASAIAHPSRQLYTDSDVNLDAATGKLRWYYQGVPNDFMDHDMQTSPISASSNGLPIVIGSGKVGIVYAMNAHTGKLIWKTPVGEHNGHDDDSRLALEHKSKLKAPYTIAPGSLGGVLSNLALAGDTVYVVTCNLPFTAASLTQVLGRPTASLGTAGGEAEALDLATGEVEWDTKLPGLPFGAATVSNDLLFTTLYKGVLVAIDRHTGKIVLRLNLPTSTNSTIAVAGNTVLVPAGGPIAQVRGGHPQLVAYTVR
jgi:alcohol dehydrogenase (cytochrome c)